jgi:NAD+ synthase
VPQVIIDKAPSADLWVGQTDEEELGYTYHDLDQLLHLLVEKQLTVEQCIEEGIAEDFVQAVISRVKRYRYKSTMPLAGSVGQYPLSDLEQIPAFK